MGTVTEGVQLHSDEHLGRITMTIVNIILGGPGDLLLARSNSIFFMGPRDLRSTPWYLNKVRLPTWDHFPVVVKTEGSAA